jgi:nitroimidazol reductase NimA-like FMN-containing flavoprotein (pyridoxamine 5'-phosphate oxidase superfamily)
MRRSEFEIKNKQLIEEVLNSVEYGTLALCKDNIPYSVPVNFVYDDNSLYFHGAKKGKKKEWIVNNSFASFSAVESYAMIQSYFSSNDHLACPATQFFKSVFCDGHITILEAYAQKAKALELLMQKLQKEGQYKPLDDSAYEKMINATEVYKLDIENMSGKIKLGQHLSTERFEMILEHLQNRGSEMDKLTIEQMKAVK